MSTPDRTQGWSAAAIEAIRQKLQPIFDARYALKTTATTTLPTIARDGSTLTYKTLAASTLAVENTKWTLTWDAADSYWYAAGQPLVSEVDTSETTTSATYVDLTTVGPRITLPFNGDYLFTYGALMLNQAASAFCVMSVDFTGGGALDADEVVQRGISAGDDASVSRTRIKTGLTKGTIVTAKYRSDTAGNTSQFVNRFLNVLPLRVH